MAAPLNIKISTLSVQSGADERTKKRLHVPWLQGATAAAVQPGGPALMKFRDGRAGRKAISPNVTLEVREMFAYDRRG